MSLRRPLLLLAGLTLTTPALLFAQQAGEGGSQWTVGATGNAARYRVREQLAGVEFENDAVGETRAITGGLRLDADGAVVPDDSRMVIDLRPLKSDKDRRDGYLQRRTLATAEFPNATLVVTRLEGLPNPLPARGQASVVIHGDLTLRDRTFATRWEGAASFDGDHVTGSVATSFTFEEAGLDKPSVMAVLSVKDTIALEYDFHFIKAP
jgi:polyisoprenoid-binding protein YceI